jgi:hypothetical protein
MGKTVPGWGNMEHFASRFGWIGYAAESKPEIVLSSARHSKPIPASVVFGEAKEYNIPRPRGLP